MSQSNDQRASEAVRAAFVASLFHNPRTVVTATFLQLATVLTIYASSHHLAYLVVAFGIASVGVLRIVWNRRFERIAPDLSYGENADYWERSQLVLVPLGALMLGMFAFVGVFVAPTGFSEIAAAILIGGAALTVVAKYYGSSALVYLAVSALALPFLFALVLVGDLSHYLLAILYLPFALVVGRLAGTLRNTLFSSARGAYLVADIADKFDTALNNMPHGLIMVDSRNSIEVANRSVLAMLNLPLRAKLEGRSLRTIFRLAHRKGLFSDAGICARAYEDVEQLTRQADRPPVRLRLLDGRTMQVTGKRRAKGGAVLVIEDITERILAEEKIARMARFDELTGLPNRAHFSERASAMLRSGQVCLEIDALYVLDLDGFKGVNDSHGHQTGDALLRAIGHELDRMQGHNLLAARLGGDEFVVFATELTGADEAENLARTLADRLGRVYELGSVRHRASISIGYALRDSEPLDLQDLMMRADLALYERKFDRGKPFVRYNDDIDRARRERMQLRADLGAAIRDGDLTLVYQPVISVEDRKLVACEALVRWTHPKLGPISPGVFVPLAEQMGIVSDITTFVLNEATKACAGWPGDVGISVNLSALDFEHDDLVERVEHALRESGLPPTRLDLEITETTALKNIKRVSLVLGYLRNLGCGISLDDFGVGYSGLSQLHALPLDRLKVDRSFTQSLLGDAKKMKLLTAILGMAEALDLSTTVEGIEDYETLERVLAAGPVRRIQGFVFGGHHTASQITDLARRVYPMNARDVEEANSETLPQKRVVKLNRL